MQKLPLGFKIGHWTDMRALTGCTVILCPPKTVASCDVRGNSPGSRELMLLAPERRMQEVHAVCSRVILINEGRIVLDGTVEDMEGTDKDMEGRFRQLTGAAR